MDRVSIPNHKRKEIKRKEKKRNKRNGMEDCMKILIIGLGSMGKRRIRCLKSLNENDIWGFDESDKTAQAVYHEYEINVCSRRRDLKNWILEYEFDAMLVCTPPTMKDLYIELANENSIPVFCEADIQAYEGEYYPSRTLIYHPAIKKIRELLKAKELGTIYTFNYHLGQHLRDWHKGADYKKYYAAQEKTGACKEMFCFEVAWLSWLFGEATDAKGFISKNMNDEEITADDVYAAVVKFERKVADWKWYQMAYSSIYDDAVTGTVLIDIVSRPAIRELRIVGQYGTMTWNWKDDFIHIVTDKKDVVERFDKGQAAAGYNENIPEQMYIDEVKAFLHDAAGKKSIYTYQPEYDYSKHEEARILEMLRRVEE
jgi:predicted dehydrogenase